MSLSLITHTHKYTQTHTHTHNVWKYENISYVLKKCNSKFLFQFLTKWNTEVFLVWKVLRNVRLKKTFFSLSQQCNGSWGGSVVQLEVSQVVLK